MPRIGVLLSGCGVYDGSEIHEAVITLLALDRAGAQIVCTAPDVDQHDVINHLTQEPMKEKRNVLVESARIARGEIRNLKDVHADDLDGLIIPGGFGAAKNLGQLRLYSAAGLAPAPGKKLASPAKQYYARTGSTRALVKVSGPMAGEILRDAAGVLK